MLRFDQNQKYLKISYENKLISVEYDNNKQLIEVLCLIPAIIKSPQYYFIEECEQLYLASYYQENSKIASTLIHSPISKDNKEKWTRSQVMRQLNILYQEETFFDSIGFFRHYLLENEQNCYFDDQRFIIKNNVLNQETLTKQCSINDKHKYLTNDAEYSNVERGTLFQHQDIDKQEKEVFQKENNALINFEFTTLTGQRIDLRQYHQLQEIYIGEFKGEFLLPPQLRILMLNEFSPTQQFLQQIPALEAFQLHGSAKVKEIDLTNHKKLQVVSVDNRYIELMKLPDQVKYLNLKAAQQKATININSLVNLVTLSLQSIVIEKTNLSALRNLMAIKISLVINYIILPQQVIKMTLRYDDSRLYCIKKLRKIRVLYLIQIPSLVAFFDNIIEGSWEENQNITAPLMRKYMTKLPNRQNGEMPEAKQCKFQNVDQQKYRDYINVYQCQTVHKQQKLIEILNSISQKQTKKHQILQDFEKLEKRIGMM